VKLADSSLLKESAALRALDLVCDGMWLGLGTGSTAARFVEALGVKVAAGLKVLCVPSSEATRAQAEALGIPLTTLDETPHLHLTVDGADEIDDQLRLIKGGGGALLREKIVATASDQMVVIADDRKLVKTLGLFPLPVEVVRFGFAATRRMVEAMAAQAGCKGEITQRLGKDGAPTGSFQLGMELHAKYTVFAEGARGHLGKQLIAKFKLDEGRDPQSYGIGLKELWEVPASQHKPGLVIHTAGWPLESDTYGGSFLYHAEDNKVALGFVVGLDYANPWLSPFEEFQRWKTHPEIRKHLEGGKRLGYGARAITAGGILSLPKLVFPGGALVGCEAGTLNASRIKGSHAAIKTGMLAAEAAFEALAAGRQRDELAAYPAAFEASWLHAELRQAKNFKQWFKKGRTTATLMTGIEQWLLPKLGFKEAPWTIHRTKADHLYLKSASQCVPIAYPKPDGKLTFDRLSSVFVSNTNHEENQPAHLTLKDASVPVATNLAMYAGPESRYCPAGVYEFVKGDDGQDRLQINAQNCVHCKTCDIKDPTQNIVWVTPEGGGGPNYAGM